MFVQVVEKKLSGSNLFCLPCVLDIHPLKYSYFKSVLFLWSDCKELILLSL